MRLNDLDAYKIHSNNTWLWLSENWIDSKINLGLVDIISFNFGLLSWTFADKKCLVKSFYEIK